MVRQPRAGLAGGPTATAPAPIAPTVVTPTLLAPALVALVAAAGLAGCSGSAERTGDSRLKHHVPTGVGYSPRVVADGVAVPKGGGVYKLGSPYQIAGRWYVPREEPGYDATGIGSWYGADFHGRRTANGEIYDMDALTAAHPTLPMPSLVWVTNQANGRSLLVRVNDRGPYSRDRIIDLSRRAARELGYDGQGTAQLRVRYAGPAPLDGNDARERQVLASAPWRGGGMAYAAHAVPTPPSRVPYAAAAPAPSPTDAYQPAVNAGAWSVSGYRQGIAGQRRSLGGPVTD